MTARSEMRDYMAHGYDAPAWCECCGQSCTPDDAWTVRGFCADCRKRLYGGAERFVAPPLFASGPVPMAGQCEMFNPDD